MTDTVCDNTRACALAETGQAYKVKHSRYSQLRLADARDALAMVYTLADEFTAEIKQLCQTRVSDEQWRGFLNAHTPLVDPQGRDLQGRSATSARLKRAALVDLYRHDPRCAPWVGTAHGVLAAVNTYERTTRPPCAAPPAPIATCCAPSRGSSARSTGRAGTPSAASWRLADPATAHAQPGAGIWSPGAGSIRASSGGVPAAGGPPKCIHQAAPAPGSRHCRFVGS